MTDKNKRGALKAKLTTFSKFMKSIQDKQKLDEVDVIQIKERLNKVYTIIDEFEEIQMNIESQSENIETEQGERQMFEDSYYLEIAEIQMNIESQSENIETEQGERQMFEDSYYLEIAVAKKVIQNYENNVSTECNTIASGHASNSVKKKVIQNYENNVSTECNTIASGHASNSVYIKLPTIKLPKFEGKYSNWLEFRDTYESLIHTCARH
ncbi:hypothetical protein QE152_g39548 [Popillia japonica]|uniref:Uncharacterized protein n=1 Tax=Popillia japonica TaxID=7064 RepID=A0AAW1HTY7_POPJA